MFDETRTTIRKSNEHKRKIRTRKFDFSLDLLLASLLIFCFFLSSASLLLLGSFLHFILLLIFILCHHSQSDFPIMLFLNSGPKSSLSGMTNCSDELLTVLLLTIALRPFITLQDSRDVFYTLLASPHLLLPTKLVCSPPLPATKEGKNDRFLCYSCYLSRVLIFLCCEKLNCLTSKQHEGDDLVLEWMSGSKRDSSRKKQSSREGCMPSASILCFLNSRKTWSTRKRGMRGIVWEDQTNGWIQGMEQWKQNEKETWTRIFDDFWIRIR